MQLYCRKQLSRSYDLGENAALARAVESNPDALMVCDTSQPGWRVLLVNEKWVQATGQAAETSDPLGLASCSLCEEHHRAAAMTVVPRVWWLLTSSLGFSNLQLL